MAWFITGLIGMIVGLVMMTSLRRRMKATVVRLSERYATEKEKAEEQQRRTADRYSSIRDFFVEANSVKKERDAVAVGVKLVLLLGVGLIALGVLIIGLNSYTIVPPRNVGVVNTLGNANDSLSSGPHLVAPWSSIETVDATNKPIQLNDDGSVENGCTSIPIRLKSQSTACQDVFLQWAVDEHATNVNELWKAYRGANDDLIDNIQGNVLLPRLKSEMQRIFSTYDPLAILHGGQYFDPTTLQEPVKEAMLKDMPPGVVLLDLRFAQIHYDALTQGRLNAYAQAQADTRIAEQQEQTAQAQAAANKALAGDPATSNPGVQYQNCLNLIKDLATKGQLGNLPQAFSCGNGNLSGIIVNGK